MERNSNKQVDTLARQLSFSKNGRKVIYLAVPISSGLRLWRLAAERGLSDLSQVRRRFPTEYESKVLRPNLQDAEMALTVAQREYPNHRVVNPGKVSVAGWSQGQYRRAWKAFISKFITTVLVSEGWPYSRGCVDEVLHALKIRVPVVDIHKNELSQEEVYEQLRRAKSEATRMGLSVSFLTTILASWSNAIDDRSRSSLLYK
jgi:hypothetical protein